MPDKLLCGTTVLYSLHRFAREQYIGSSSFTGR